MLNPHFPKKLFVPESALRQFLASLLILNLNFESKRPEEKPMKRKGQRSFS
jgi:hypothetical protein